jgi:hypothetical protein
MNQNKGCVPILSLRIPRLSLFWRNALLIEGSLKITKYDSAFLIISYDASTRNDFEFCSHLSVTSYFSIQVKESFCQG